MEDKMDLTTATDRDRFIKYLNSLDDVEDMLDICLEAIKEDEPED